MLPLQVRVDGVRAHRVQGALVLADHHVVTRVAGVTGTPITVNVAVAAIAVPSVTNNAVVSGGNEPPAKTGNNLAADYTTVVRVSVQ